jgi:hypothetical protein
MVRTGVFKNGQRNRQRNRRASPLPTQGIVTECANKFLECAQLELPSYREFLQARERRLQAELISGMPSEKAASTRKRKKAVDV